jgi:hypothetical protein
MSSPIEETKMQTTPATKKRKATKKQVVPSEDEAKYVQTIFSEFEVDDPVVVTAKEAFEHELTFGKHKGSTIKEVMKTQKGRNYLRYVREKWDGLRENQKAVIDKALGLYDAM